MNVFQNWQAYINDVEKELDKLAQTKKEKEEPSFIELLYKGLLAEKGLTVLQK